MTCEIEKIAACNSEDFNGVTYTEAVRNATVTISNGVSILGVLVLVFEIFVVFVTISSEPNNYRSQNPYKHI